MEQNTGNKLATKVIITKTLGGKSEEKQYSIGQYADGAFVVLSAAELAKLSDTDYRNCISDTKRYIAQAEGIENIDSIFTNEPSIYDTTACPIEIESNDYIISLTVEDQGHSWSGIAPINYDVLLKHTCPNKPAPSKSKYIVIENNRADGIKTYEGEYTRFLTPNFVISASTSIEVYPISSKIVHVGDFVDINDPNLQNLLNMKNSDAEYQYKVFPNVVNFIPEKPILELNGEYKIENNKIYTRITADSPIKSNIEFYIGATKSANKFFTVPADSTKSEWIACRDNSTTEFVAVEVNLHLVGGEKTRFDDFYRYVVKNQMWTNGIK